MAIKEEEEDNMGISPLSTLLQDGTLSPSPPSSSERSAPLLSAISPQILSLFIFPTPIAHWPPRFNPRPLIKPSSSSPHLPHPIPSCRQVRRRGKPHAARRRWDRAPTLPIPRPPLPLLLLLQVVLVLSLFCSVPVPLLFSSVSPATLLISVLSRQRNRRR